MEPWYKVTQPRKEVREGRSFHPDEFAIALQQVVAGTAPEDYRQPEQFFARNYFTRALTDHTGMVLPRLAGKTEHTAPVLTLVTQFGGGKTHTLTTLYHLARNGPAARTYAGVSGLLQRIGLPEVPEAAVAVFVGNAWDPQPGRETPWLDIARQLAGDAGVEALGRSAETIPPGTDVLGRLFRAANRPVLVLCDEVLNFCNRHRSMVEAFYAFIQNLTVAMTGTTHSAAMISLPRSQVEMTDWDQQWQERITRVVQRVSQDLIVNDEAEISEVIRRRLFEHLGSDRSRRSVARAYADWCFDRRAQLPPEWTAVDRTTTEADAREFLCSRFEACYPFHPATLSVFQRKWQALTQYQQTRGTLAMLAQWVSCALREGYRRARREPLITLGSAPLEVSEFLAVVLGQLGESRLLSAIDTDIAGTHAHARALDADTTDELRDIHRRVGTAIFFESSGGQKLNRAALPELRFALGEPGLDTTSIDNAATALAERGFFIRKEGGDRFWIGHKPTLKKVVNDRRASLDHQTDIRPAMQRLILEEFRKGTPVAPVPFPEDGNAVPDSPKLTLVILPPDAEWTGGDELRRQIAAWTKARGASPRLYPAALIWCVKKPGRDLREKIELWLAWRRVASDVENGLLGADFEPAELREITTEVREAEKDARDEVWAGYRYIVFADSHEESGLKVLDLGAGHANGGATLWQRVTTALRSHALLNETIGAGYIERNWPPALSASGAWPLSGLRQSFVNGTLTRLLDPDVVLGNKIVEFVSKGDFGLASGTRTDGSYDRLWFKEIIPPEEVAFESGVFLLKRERAQQVVSPPTPQVETETQPPDTIEPPPGPEQPEPPPVGPPATVTLRLSGTIPREVWNRLGTKLLPKLPTGDSLSITVEFSASLDSSTATHTESEIRQVLADLGLQERVRLHLGE